MEIYQEFGNDLMVGANGDLMPADGITLSNQRIIRRLLTNPQTTSTAPDYLQQPTYGAGLPEFIGLLNTPENFKKAKGRIIEQMYLEPTVSQVPPPEIEINSSGSEIRAKITYTYKPTNQQVVIDLKV